MHPIAIPDNVTYCEVFNTTNRFLGTEVDLARVRAVLASCESLRLIEKVPGEMWTITIHDDLWYELRVNPPYVPRTRKDSAMPDRLTGRSVDDLPVPDRQGVTWNWSLNDGCYRGWCLVQPFVFEVLVHTDPADQLAGPHDYAVTTTARFGGYELYRGRRRLPVHLRQLTPDTILKIVEEHDLLRDAINGAHTLIHKATVMINDADTADRWHDDRTQFARLLDETNAAGAFTAEVMASLTASMDLAPDRVRELLDRAETVWDAAKG